MWYLTSQSDPRILYIFPTKEITVGRSVDVEVCNFAITDDPSISRRHATLSVSDNNLFLLDLGSRYGTFVNESAVTMDKVKLNSNDVIKFGKMGCIWTVNETRFVTCTSTLKGENLQNLKQCLGSLGASLKNEWDDTCTYLTMPAITLTIKVVLALVQSSHIVTTDFWSKCLEAVNNNTKLPNPVNFSPQVIESTLNRENVSFLPNDRRRHLFAGKTFVFFSKRQLEMYKAVILNCSATPILLSESKMTKATLCEPNIIVVQYNVTNTSQETQAQRSQINDIVTYLKGKGKRVVGDAEIGLAILYCSRDKNCNPDFNFSSEVIKQTSGQTMKSKILAQESQEQTTQAKRDNVVINESLNSTGSNSKRKMSDDNDVDMNAAKKLATGNVNASNNESGKRKFADDSNEPENPNKKMAVNDDDDMFNFMTNSIRDNESSEKKLHFSKPQKRKADTGNEDDLFNFVQDSSNTSADTSKNMFDSNKVKEEPDANLAHPKVKKSYTEEKIDISALRGSKLKELEQINLNTAITNNVRVKKEEADDLDQKMQDLVLGSTVITIRSDLIKKEPIDIEVPSIEPSYNGVKNFKKFKKVWPVYKQSIMKTSISINIPDSSDANEMISQSY